MQKGKTGKRWKHLMNDYELYNLVGQGTYGDVLKAKSKQTGQIVAIKHIKRCTNSSSASRKTISEV